MEAYILRSFVFFSLFFSCDLNLILSPRPYAVVKEGRELELTCQSNRSGGVYWFYTVDDHGRQIELGTGGGDFKYCVNQTQLVTIECSFEEPWTFKLTLLAPVHNQIIFCARTLNRVVSNSSATIFIQGSKLVLEPEMPAFVKRDQTLELTCQFNEPVGLYSFYTIDVEGRRISLGFGGGGFKMCLSYTNETILKCNFEERIWTVKLTLLNPIHNQIIGCSTSINGTILSVNTTIFVQVSVSTLTLSTPQTTVRASRSISITCITNDPVRPAANITWYKGTSEIFTQITTLIQPDANDLYRTVSVLQYTGVPEDNGQQVYCRASNIEGEHVESSRYTLNVTLVSSAQMYVIESAAEEDTGNYTCTAYNSAGNSSGTVDIYVQSKPMKPTITLVDCDVTSATILWSVSTSLNFRYIPPFQQETLQLSEKNEGFLNCSYENIKTNLSSVYIYRAPDLNPSTEYKFRIVASNVHGSSFSDSRACYTAGKPLTSTCISKDCEKGFIIGGSLGGVFILIILIGGSAFFIYRQMNRKKQQTAEQSDHYVHHICSTNEHHYQDISYQNRGAVKAIERAEYMELPDTNYTNDDGQ